MIGSTKTQLNARCKQGHCIDAMTFSVSGYYKSIISPILQTLHWLPIKFGFSYKIVLLAYKALKDLAPAYLTNLL